MKDKFFRKYLPLISLIFIAIFLLIKIDTVWEFIASVFFNLTPLWISIILYYIFDKPVSFIERQLGKIPKLKNKKIATTLSLIITFILFIGFIVILVLTILPSFQQSLTDFFSNYDFYIQTMNEWADSLTNFLNDKHLDPAFIENVRTSLVDFGKGLTENGLTFARSMVGNVVSAIGTIILSLFFSLYLLVGERRIHNRVKRFLRAVSGKHGHSVIYIVGMFDRICRNYFFIQITEGLILGGICLVAFTLFQLPYAIILSVMIAFFALIPAIGAWMAGLLGVALLALVDAKKILIFLAVYLVIQQIEGNFIYPHRVNTMIGLPAIFVMIAVILGLGLGGLSGAIISVPIATTLYKLTKEWILYKEGHKVIAFGQHNKTVESPSFTGQEE